MSVEARPRQITLRAAAVWAVTVVAACAMLLLMWQLAEVLLLIFAAILLAIFLRGLAAWVARFTQLSAGVSLAIVLCVLTALAAAGFYFGGHAVANQLAELAEQIPQSLDKLRAQLEKSEWGSWIVRQTPDSAEQLPVSGADVTSYASQAVTSIVGGIAGAIIILFLALYLAIDPRTYSAGVVRLFPVSMRARAADVMRDVRETLEWWLLGKILSMIVVAVFTYVGLLLIGVPLALALSLIAGLLAFVPNFGPVASAIPAVLLGFVISPMTAVYVVVLYLVVQTIESYLVTPLIQQQTVSLPPGLTIGAQVAMGVLLGGGGVVLATPLTAAALVLVRRLYVEDVLEKPSHAFGGG